MANATTPTEMVASDQLFKSALQQSNTSISDKLEELSKKYSSFMNDGDCDKIKFISMVDAIKDDAEKEAKKEKAVTDYGRNE